MNRIKYRPQLNSVLAVLFVVCLFSVAGIFFDFYYDLNDDVLIKDILSGAYTGTPDAHSIQMLYPISFLISLLYKGIPSLPWQGIFLCSMHGICFYLIAKRSLSFVNKIWKKAMLLLMEALLILTVFLWEMVLVQYTVTAALLASCACFLVFTSEKKDRSVDFWKEQFTAVILVILAFNIRSEMLLLMSPFIAFTGIFKWSGEKGVFAKENVKKYMGLVGMILAGMVVSLAVDTAAYASPEWKTFRDFFDARTKVYDYTWYPDYEQAEDFYKELGVSPAQWELIDNYNFGLDESIDAKLLWEIADYAEQTGIKEPFFVHLKTALEQYKWRTFHAADAPYNALVLAAYAMVTALAVIRKDKSLFFKLPLLLIFRTIPWMYVIWADRVPARISHPLYYIEFLILCAWMLSYLMKDSCKRKAQRKDDSKEIDSAAENAERGAKIAHDMKRPLMVCAVLLGVYALIHLPASWQALRQEMIRRETVNAPMKELERYAVQFAVQTEPQYALHNEPQNAEHVEPQNAARYYLMDVYSTVGFSEKMFKDVDNSQKNYDILGGWASGSPLQRQALTNYYPDAFTRAELLLLDHFYFVIEENRDPAFLSDFYQSMGIAVWLNKIETLGEENPLIVYEVLPDMGGMEK